MLLGLPPIAFLAGHLMYGFGTAYGRQLEINLPLRVLVPFGESVLDLAARFQYPVRTAGDRVVMISAPVANANAQVAAMDRHIRALEARLGRTGTRRVHWLRGPLLGMQGKGNPGDVHGKHGRRRPGNARRGRVEDARPPRGRPRRAQPVLHAGF